MRRMPFVIDNYTFTVGGIDDILTLDIVNDKAQGLGTPARSMAISNSGPGTLYYMISEDGMRWSGIASIAAGGIEGYDYNDGVNIYSMVLWASLANTIASVRAAPGVI
jgi:hypothetical protein